jgi:predicted Zn-dependent peptidase
VTDAELQRAKRELLGRYTAHLERSEDVSDDLAVLFVDQLAPDYLSRLGSSLDGITQQDLIREAERLDPEELTVVVVGDARQLNKPLLEIAGAVQPAPPELSD